MRTMRRCASHHSSSRSPCSARSGARGRRSCPTWPHTTSCRAGPLPVLPLLVIAVIAFAAGSGAYDVAINGAAMGDSVWSRPARLTLLHAGFSGGGVVGAIGGGAAIGGGIRFELVYPVFAGCP